MDDIRLTVVRIYLTWMRERERKKEESKAVEHESDELFTKNQAPINEFLFIIGIYRLQLPRIESSLPHCLNYLFFFVLISALASALLLFVYNLMANEACICKALLSVTKSLFGTKERFPRA